MQALQAKTNEPAHIHTSSARKNTLQTKSSGGNVCNNPFLNLIQKSPVNDFKVALQSPAQAKLSIQRDLAVPVPNPGAEAPEMSDEQIQSAVEFNTRRFRLDDGWEVSLIRDVLGLDREPAVVDADLIQSIAQYQAENNITADGKVGAVTAARLSRELFHEGRDMEGADRREVLRSSRRMGTRAMRIQVNRPATLNDNLGSATYGVMWIIPDRAANGYVIQHVTIQGTITNCSGSAVNMVGFEGARNYWEVWRVINGRVQCGNLAGSCVGSDDTFTTASQNSGTRGTIVENGQVSYYPDYLLDANWVTGVHPAGDLPHRASQPPFWNEGETMRHRMTVTYDDCTPGAVSTVRTTP